MTELLFPLKGHRKFILLVFFSPLKAIGGERGEFLNSNVIYMNEITLNVFETNFSDIQSLQ